jgi:hypothetical protein
MAKHLLLIILAGLFLGCAHTAGTQYNSAAVDRISLGQTTESDVVAMMGAPLWEQKLSNGIKVYHYAYGDRCPLGSAIAVDSSEIQFYDGVAIYKYGELMWY